MQAFHKTFATLKSQLSNLTPTAKLLIASLMVIIVMVLFLVAQYTSRSAMEPLGLNTNLSPDARTRAVSYLQTRNISHRERGGEILVPPNQKHAILAQLTDGEIITPDQIDFDSLVRQDSPFLSKAQNRKRWLTATMNQLSRTIRHMQDIERADVVIAEPENPGGIGRANIPATASVTVWTRGSRGLEQDQVDAIAEMVAGAHARLSIENVSIINSSAGQRHYARSRDALASSSNLELQVRKERILREKLNEALSYIPGINVAVQVTVDTREIFRRTRDIEDPKHGVTAESRREIVSSRHTDEGEAGVRPNTGASIAGSGAGSRMTDERSESSMIPAFGGADSRITDRRGLPLQINASIGVPRNYFVRLWQQQQPEGNQDAQPEQAELEALIQAENDRIRAQILPLIDTRAIDEAVAGDVHVSMIPDFAMAAMDSPAGPAVQEAGTFGDIADEGMVTYLTLAGLALLALVMMFLMVRKANTKEELPTAEELAGAPPTLGDDNLDLVGEAGESPLSMEGLELDDDDLKRQQMLEQIKEMAKHQPNEAATLLRRWIKAEV